MLLLVEHPKPDKALFSQLNTVDTFQRVPSHDRFSVYTSTLYVLGEEPSSVD